MIIRNAENKLGDQIIIPSDTNITDNIFSSTVTTNHLLPSSIHFILLWQNNTPIRKLTKRPTQLTIVYLIYAVIMIIVSTLRMIIIILKDSVGRRCKGDKNSNKKA